MDFKTRLRNYFLKLCQDSWDLQNNNKSHVIQSLVDNIPCSSNTRNESVIVTRCGIGHNRMTHNFILNEEFYYRTQRCTVFKVVS